MKNIALFLFLLLLPFTAHAQSPEWINYTSGKTITAIAPEGNVLWVGTTGGLVSIDTQSGATNFYNMFNSGLPSNQIHEMVAVFSVPGAESYWTTVNAMVSDLYGNIWIGGRYGLVLFNENGIVFTAQHEAKKALLPPAKYCSPNSRR